MSISQRTRWRVFQRDNLTCQYCGRSAIDTTDIKLEVDHIKPLSKGETDYIDNLCTSCFDCNRGKHADRLVLKIKTDESKEKPKGYPYTKEFLAKHPEYRNLTTDELLTVVNKRLLEMEGRA